MKSVQLQQKRSLINGKIIIGIDPAKAKHQAVIINTHGVQLGKSFSFDVSLDGYAKTLWQKLTQILTTCIAGHLAASHHPDLPARSRSPQTVIEVLS